ncbi:type I inositol polyphosphate 5-phosphatase 10 [Physcomitrium patens]|uniref:Inositol polyphosphate-related phosphatase domain-containing protein n=1 Tax=Physcomitrium patens TaxID=3218 RepID=A0A2K1J0W9_PHYPA|nr:type IV inositol polyphosphate 5-phosphatase 6-like isoform X1 [Physcomitrium patens]XP_024402190.1 type IV inositol polyphosphate 5-phosphatase 6-like isoform X1 [Physcomitrium patens]XP_024402192.1 type IV inositol polyphosphate 5-phosphatase 6-like isoform X1 [Physcomitrium patens]PNR35167.1 hypothetical protein PHYPA_023066 [Physcomitrium patens]|eukprot:XP_024402189.1 type IV inositol polyphosphate 5-phosphatase 6-like isoform X1 [Physcomitrella patens]
MQGTQSEFWPRQLLKKWISFQETGDDFNRDSDSNSERFSESEDFEESDDINYSNPIPRVQSDTLHERFVQNNDYKVAVGTWNVGGLLPPDDIDLDGFLDSSDPADIYVLGFQEIVPLNASNVLCIEDDAPTVIWDGLIRQALNNRVKCFEEHVTSHSAPTSPTWDEQEFVSPSSEVSDFESLRTTVATEGTLESSLLLPKISNPSDSQWPSDRIEARKFVHKVHAPIKDVRVAEDWVYEASMPDNGVTRRMSSMKSSRNLRTHSCNKYLRVASKQMVGVFISIWVRSDLRRYVHNVKVSVVGCGILNYLRNKGAVSVSMSLHQTSFCFVCTHLTSGLKEGDEFRRNADVADVLRRTTFPRLDKLSGIHLPETIMAHDRIIWLGDLNYRIDLPDKETWILVNQCDWKSLLPRDQLSIERDAGRVFKGWHEEVINFPPTYKFVEESDKYFGENTFEGDKRRTPAWCDRILSYGKGLRQLSYSMVEARLSDHRPVIAKFFVEVEAVNCQKLTKACKLSKHAKVNVEELLLKDFSVNNIRSLFNNEML